jgi:hypothetical protein
VTAPTPLRENSSLTFQFNEARDRFGDVALAFVEPINPMSATMATTAKVVVRSAPAGRLFDVTDTRTAFALNNNCTLVEDFWCGWRVAKFPSVALFGAVLLNLVGIGPQDVCTEVRECHRGFGLDK